MPGLASLSKSLISRINERKSQVLLSELDSSDNPIPGGSYLGFQYFPETITDTKAVNYQTREIPGGSLPLYQWISSGERVISFQAYFTSDVDLTVNPDSYAKLQSNGQLRRNVDVRTALLWLRRFMLPRYGNSTEVGVPLTFAPRKLIMYVPGMGLGIQGGSLPAQPAGTSLDEKTRDQLLVIMTQCDISYEAEFPSGLPRIASVQLAFAQIAQRSGTVNFPSGSDFLDNLVTGGAGNNNNNKMAPYPIKVKFQ
jgi:hypothetical protein